MADEARREVERAQGTTNWDRFIYWTGLWHAVREFDELERNYKVEIAQRVAAARSALERNDPGWVDLLHHAIADKPNNLTSWRQTQPLEAWCRNDPDAAALAFRLLWNPDLAVPERFNAFAGAVTAAGLKAPISETSFFHMAMGVEEFPIFRATPVDRAMHLTAYPTPRESGVKPGDIGRRYDHFLFFLDAMIKRARDRGIAFRDRLDAQSAAWIVTQWPPHDEWSEAVKQAYLEYQGPATLRKDSWTKKSQVIVSTPA